MRVDIRKLDAARVAVDDAIAEVALKAGCTRIDALLALIADLGFEPKVLEHEAWYFASAMTTSEQMLATRIYLRRGTQDAVTYESRILRQRLSVAYTFEDAALALLCRLLDPKLDLELGVYEPRDRIEFAARTTRDDPVAEYVYYLWDDIDTALGPAGLKREMARRNTSEDLH